MITIRKECAADVEAVREVNLRAFERPAEANLVDKLRESCDDFISLVAVADGAVVGHILFTPATIEIETGVVRGMGLAPMAVLPERQNEGIGSELVRAGLEEVRRRGCPFVIVLGHPHYYPRFGFEIARPQGILCEWEVPDEPFMVLFMDEEKMSGVKGVAKYRPEFAEAM